jgi:hypothetical protein
MFRSMMGTSTLVDITRWEADGGEPADDPRPDDPSEEPR